MYSHNQKDPDLIYNTNMSIETILTKKTSPVNSKMWSAFILRLKLLEIYM